MARTVACLQCGGDIPTGHWDRIPPRTCKDCKAANWAACQRRRRAARIGVLVRRAVYARDGMRCCYCGIPVRRRRHKDDTERDTAEIDHIVAVRDGGDGSIDNLALACLGCSRAKQGRELIARSVRSLSITAQAV